MKSCCSLDVKWVILRHGQRVQGHTAIRIQHRTIGWCIPASHRAWRSCRNSNGKRFVGRHIVDHWWNKNALWLIWPQCSVSSLFLRVSGNGKNPSQWKLFQEYEEEMTKIQPRVQIRTKLNVDQQTTPSLRPTKACCQCRANGEVNEVCRIKCAWIFRLKKKTCKYEMQYYWFLTPINLWCPEKFYVLWIGQKSFWRTKRKFCHPPQTRAMDWLIDS